MKTITTLIGLMLFAITTLQAQKTEWKFDKDHTRIQFSAVHLGINEVTGQFKDFEGLVKANKPDFTDAEVELTIDATSIDTDNEKRDGHLKSEDFLYVEKYPEIAFKSTSFKKEADDQYSLTGKLTIRDVTREETFRVTYKGTVEAMNKTIAGFKLNGKINRFDYNVDWSEKFAKGLIVSKEIEITVNIELIKQ